MFSSSITQPAQDAKYSNLRVTSLALCNKLTVEFLELSTGTVPASTLLALYKADFNALIEDILQLSAETQSQNTEISTITLDVNDLKTQVENLETQVSNLTTQVDNLTTQVNNLTTQVSDLETQYDNTYWHNVLAVYPYNFDVADWTGTFAVGNGGNQAITENSTAIGNFLQFDMDTQSAGLYRVQWGMYLANSMGIVDVSLNGALQESGVDGYANASVPSPLMHQYIYTHAGGNLTLRWDVTGKNASSSNFRVYIVYVFLEKFGVP
jgi:uncharacterized phage infection (PIP) family protein YhgE